MKNHSDSALFTAKNTAHPTRDHIDAALFGGDPLPSPQIAALHLELRAWRFLATHRVSNLKVTHVSFIDGDDGPAVNTPSVDGFYESANGATFGEAAVSLAFALGMPCGSERKSPAPATLSLGMPSEDAACSSSAPTAGPISGAKSASSRRTRSRATASTTGATSAEASTDEIISGDGAREYLDSLRREALRSAAEWEKYGYAAEGDVRRTVAKWLGGLV